MVKAGAVAICVVAASCGTFEDRNVVIDTRILAMVATPPEQVVDLTAMQDPARLLEQLVPVRVCALVTDPTFARRLRYQLTICDPDQGRCDPDELHEVIASGFTDDPDLAIPSPQLCGTIQPNRGLLEIALSALQDDALHGLGGVRIGVELRVGGEDADPALDQFSIKSVVFQPKIPPTRVPNRNPSLAGLSAAIADGPEMPLEPIRCAEATAPAAVRAGQKIRLTPVEPDDARESYEVPTLDGGLRTFTETLTYQWVVTGGELTRGTTGGPRDRFGNAPPLFTEFTAPRPTVNPAAISLWVIQRDERLGAAWLETCLSVEP